MYSWMLGLCLSGDLEWMWQEAVMAFRSICVERLEDSDWETLGQRRTIARLCVLFKVCCGERAWKAIRTGCEGLTV
jgi:hypothetical protein